MFRLISRVSPVLILTVAGISATPTDADSPDRAARIEDQLLAPCCYAESVRVHRSELAAQMRIEIRRAVGAGLSDQKILDAYVARYGLRILREPVGARRAWLYAVVLTALAGGFLTMVLAIRKSRKRSQAEPATAPDVSTRPEEILW